MRKMGNQSLRECLLADGSGAGRQREPPANDGEEIQLSAIQKTQGSGEPVPNIKKVRRVFSRFDKLDIIFVRFIVFALLYNMIH